MKFGCVLTTSLLLFLRSSFAKDPHKGILSIVILLLLVSPGMASQLVCRIHLLAHIIKQKSKLLVIEQMLVLHDSTKKVKLFAVIRFVGVRVLYAVFVCFTALDCTIW